jgi:hypothetical protein
VRGCGGTKQVKGGGQDHNAMVSHGPFAPPPTCRPAVPRPKRGSAATSEQPCRNALLALSSSAKRLAQGGRLQSLTGLGSTFSASKL